VGSPFNAMAKKIILEDHATSYEKCWANAELMKVLTVSRQ
jgi:hypothetical protein